MTPTKDSTGDGAFDRREDRKPAENLKYGNLQPESLMAPSYVPEEWRLVFMRPVNRVLPSIQPPGNLRMVQELHFRLVTPPSICFCADTSHLANLPWMNIPTLPWNPSLALTQPGLARKDPEFRRDFPNMDLIKNQKSYVEAFIDLIDEEHAENMMLYERYSQYDKKHKVSISKHRATEQDKTDDAPNPSSAILEIAGIHDARPQLEPGDRVLIRPFRKVNYRKNPIEEVEIQATVITTVRAVTEKQKDKVVVTWLPKHQSSAFDGIALAVRFLPSPTTSERCLAALQWLHSLSPPSARELLFPSEIPKVSPFTLDQKSDSDLEALNKQQFEFVWMVLSRSADPTTQTVRPPMILTGPAGTGKTRTLLMSLIKTLQLDVSTTNEEIYPPPPRKRILVCTPSHTACDVVTRRLGKFLSRQELFRLYDTTRPVEMVPVEMLQFTRQGPMGEFVLPSAEELPGFQVIVCTCSDSHLLYLSGITNASLRTRRQCLKRFVETSLGKSGLTVEGTIQGAEVPYFTHLFVDEAAQATEPETLIPMSVVVDDAPGVVKVEMALIGDPRQLSPDIFSRWASPRLKKSLLERMLRLPDVGGRGHLLGPPTKDTWSTMDELIEYSFQEDDTETTKQHLSVFLTTSYRGHPSFLHMPSKLFYFDKLRSVYPNDFEESNWCRALRKIESHSILAYPSPNKRHAWPIHFRGVLGNDTSISVEAYYGSNSWCNKAEAQVVANVVQTLHQDGISTQSIGVMVAFRAQALLIRKILRRINLGSVNVGMVEDYQAVERQVIVLSLTRSQEAFLQSDIHRNAGLYKQPKRMNVALTRAANLLVVVGNPILMSEDPYWSKWLDYCREHGFWYGERLPAS